MASVAVLFAQEASMRTITAVSLALLGMALTGISANAGSWCANYLRGVSNCGYSSFEQCWATVHGLGNAFCAPKPLPGDGLRDGRRKLEYPTRRSARRSY